MSKKPVVSCTVCRRERPLGEFWLVAGELRICPTCESSHTLDCLLVAARALTSAADGEAKLTLANQRIAELEAQVVEMRGVLSGLRSQAWLPEYWHSSLDHALSSPAGVGWLSPEKAQELDLLFQSLTPGGSEFVGDPDRCVEWALDRIATASAWAVKSSKQATAMRGLLAYFRHTLRPDDALRKEIDKALEQTP